MKLARCLLALFIVLMGTAVQAEETPLTEEMQSFLTDFRLAAQQKDMGKIDSLTHPSSLSCSRQGNSKSNQRILNQSLAVFGAQAQIKKTVFQPTVEEEFARTKSKLEWQGFQWPAEPQGAIIVNFGKGSRTKMASLYIGQSSGSWKWIRLCMK